MMDEHVPTKSVPSSRFPCAANEMTRRFTVCVSEIFTADDPAAGNTRG